MGYEGHYISADDIENWPSGTSEEEKEAAIKLAEEVLEACLGRSYYPKDFDVKINGNGKNRLFIPLPEPIITVDLIEVWGVELDSAYWAFDSSSVFISPESGASEVEIEYFLKTEQGALFPWGYNNIRIKGTCGSEVPEWIKEVARILVEDKNDPTLYTHYLKSESIGNYSYTMGDSYAKTLTGIKEADDIIRLFRRKTPIFMAP